MRPTKAVAENMITRDTSGTVCLTRLSQDMSLSIEMVVSSERTVREFIAYLPCSRRREPSWFAQSIKQNGAYYNTIPNLCGRSCRFLSARHRGRFCERTSPAHYGLTGETVPRQRRVPIHPAGPVAVATPPFTETVIGPCGVGTTPSAQSSPPRSGATLYSA